MSSNDFSQFLKLLEMSGVLNGEAGSAIQAALGKGGPGLGGGKPRRPGRPGRPRGLGGRRKKPRRRPTTPRPEYDYYYDEDYSYEDYSGPQQQSDPDQVEQIFN